MAAVVSGSSANALRGAQALRFFQTHQIRVGFLLSSCFTVFIYQFK